MEFVTSVLLTDRLCWIGAVALSVDLRNAPKIPSDMVDGWNMHFRWWVSRQNTLMVPSSIAIEIP
jgi:hypothetical protein